MTVELNSNLIGNTLDFDTYAPQILGTRIKGAKFLGILDAGTAKILTDITAMHLQVYPYLPKGTPDNAMKYNYLKFMLKDGTNAYYGMPWIRPDSVSVVTTTNIHIVVKGRNHEDVVQLRKALMASGFEDFSIEVTP